MQLTDGSMSFQPSYEADYLESFLHRIGLVDLKYL